MLVKLNGDFSLDAQRLVKFTLGVNFINVFRTRFCTNFRRQVTFQLGAKNSYKKRAQKMLMKLTAAGALQMPRENFVLE